MSDSPRPGAGGASGRVGPRRASGGPGSSLAYLLAGKGHLAVVQWLCTDPRTRPLVGEGTPIGWACYTGRLECAKALLRHGADPRATDVVLWGGLPPLLVACQNGQLEAIQWLVDEVGIDVRTKDLHGKGAIHHVKTPANWEDLPSHVASLAWVKARLKVPAAGSSTATGASSVVAPPAEDEVEVVAASTSTIDEQD